jgi:uncharacterized phiE125 gp8 family phage protein
MLRTIVQPADMTGAALNDLKNWLGISRSNEDDLLTDLLLASLDLCEAFAGQAPLSQTIEEQISTSAGWYNLASRPVQNLVAVELIGQDGSRVALDTSDYEVDLRARETSSVRLLRSVAGQAVAVQLQTGIAAGWDTVPAALKQGIVRLAAHHYRDRDRTGSASSDPTPPASVTALWRPWRLLRLA